MLALILTQGVAYGAALITGADIKNGTVTSEDLKDSTVLSQDLSNEAFSGENWSVADRNVIGAGDAFLRAGPSVVTENQKRGDPPMGNGSLGIRTATGDDKAAFGNATKFVGDDLAAITVVKYWMFTTGENRAIDPANLPNLQFEIVPRLAGAGNFSTMTFIPDRVPAGLWTQVDAVATGRWVLSGGAGTVTNCQLGGDICSFAEIMTRLDDGAPTPKILSVQFSKGSDFAFSGAVDALTINTKVYDFEATEVITTTAP